MTLAPRLGRDKVNKAENVQIQSGDNCVHLSNQPISVRQLQRPVGSAVYEEQNL